MVKRVCVTAFAVAGMIALSGLGAAAATRAIKPLKLIYVQQEAAVPPGSIGQVFDSCPAAAPNGISGYFLPVSPPGPFLLGVSAPTPDGWVDGVVNPSSTTQSFVGGAVCSSRGFPFFDTTILLFPGQPAGYKVDCHRSDPKAIGGFAFPSNGNPGDVIVAESDPLPGGRSWNTVLDNLGTQPQTYYIGVFCAPMSQRVVYHSGFLNTIAPHQLKVGAGRCPRGARHAIGAFFRPARKTAWGDIALSISIPFPPTARKWGVVVTNLTSQPQNDIIGIVCLG